MTVAQPGVRRALDVVGSLMLLAVLAPAFMGAAVAASLQGGAIFASRILWVRGQRISVLEFSAGEGSIGRFLWLTRLNQLPMLFSVLRGDLSFEDPLVRLIEAAD
jgi:lipopolysaccharide/colanic/teichoic acid biosynthesis glycosyltransferase